MQVMVNGKIIRLEREMSIAEFVHSRAAQVRLVAVEYNHHWTRREDWPNIILKENDRLEVIQMMAGG